MKIGELVYCKRNYYYDGIKFEKGKSYLITYIEYDPPYEVLKCYEDGFVTINNSDTGWWSNFPLGKKTMMANDSHNVGIEYHFDSYFLSLKDQRKRKLEKLNESIM